MTVAAVLSGHHLAAGWTWDLLNGLGFASLAGMVYLAFQGRIKAQRRAHQLLSYCVLAVLSGHVLGFLLLDPVVIEYLKLGTPWYMSIGIAAFVLFLFTLIFALPQCRTRGFKNSAGFRRWHQQLGWLLILLSALHSSGAAYYLRHWYQYLLLSGLLLPLVFAGRIHRSTSAERATLWPIVSALLITCLALTVGLNIGAELSPADVARQP